MVRLLGEFVRNESFSYEKKAIDGFGAQVAREWRARGAKVRVLKNRERGDNLRIEVATSGARRRKSGCSLEVETTRTDRLRPSSPRTSRNSPTSRRAARQPDSACGCPGAKRRP